MAYLNFAEAGASVGGTTSEPTSARPSPSLSPLEWSVVALARRDSLSSLREPGRLSKALGAIFGNRKNPRLADGRLEALRRIAVLAWRNGYSIPSHELRAFLEAGFSEEQYELVQKSIARGRGAMNRRLYA